MFISVRRVVAVSAGLFALSMTPAAMAAAPYHMQDGEAGATFNPDHATQATRAQVNADLAVAMKNPAWDRIARSGAAWPAQRAAQGLTREQVSADLVVAMQNPAWDRVSRSGAAWPAK